MTRKRLILGIATLLLLVLVGAAYYLFAPQGPPAPSQKITYRGVTWTVFRPEVFDVFVDGDTLQLTLTRVARWTGNQQGGLVYQEVEGDFRATATVLARKASQPTQTVSSIVSLGGLTARNPAGADVGGAENYIHIVVGNTPSGIGVETKTTVNGATTYEAVPGPSGDAELRICRLGSSFHLYKRTLDSATWTRAAIYERTDLPSRLQVGTNIYSVLLPDLRVMVENLQIEPIVTPDKCEEP